MRWLFKTKTNKRLFLLCPTWCLETKLRKQFKDDPYFMTALGCSFSFDKSQVEQIKSLIHQNGVEKICVVANPKCKFIQNIINPKSLYNTRAEELLASIYHKKYDEIQQEHSFEDKCRKLSIYHAELQLAHFMRIPEILACIENHNIDISVLLNHTTQTHKSS